jgi:hypothetical protein
LQGRKAFAPISSRTTDTLFPSEVGRFLVSVGTGGVRLVTMSHQDTALAVETVDPATGRSIRTVPGHYQPRYTSGSYSVGLQRVQGDQLVLTVDSLMQVIDLATASVTATWPPS